jgi:hypothetical protein
VEQLIGVRVRDAQGRVAGRLEEFRATREDKHWVVTEFHLGPAALLKRLAIRHLGFAWPRRTSGYTVRWDQLNLDDPDQPTLTCDIAELTRPTRADT